MDKSKTQSIDLETKPLNTNKRNKPTYLTTYQQFLSNQQPNTPNSNVKENQMNVTENEIIHKTQMQETPNSKTNPSKSTPASSQILANLLTEPPNSTPKTISHTKNVNGQAIVQNTPALPQTPVIVANSTNTNQFVLVGGMPNQLSPSPVLIQDPNTPGQFLLLNNVNQLPVMPSLKPSVGNQTSNQFIIVNNSSSQSQFTPILQPALVNTQTNPIKNFVPQNVTIPVGTGTNKNASQYKSHKEDIVNSSELTDISVTSTSDCVINQTIDELMKAYECYICSFETIYKDVFEDHMLTHRKTRKETFHKCPKCPFKMRCKATVRKHMVVGVGGDAEYCGLYSYSNECKEDLDFHLSLYKGDGGRHLPPDELSS